MFCAYWFDYDYDYDCHGGHHHRDHHGPSENIFVPLTNTMAVTMVSTITTVTANRYSEENEGVAIGSC